MKKSHIAAAVVAAAALALSACANHSAAPAASATAAGGVSLVASGKLTVCTHLAYKPFQFTDNGKTVGFDVDLMDLVAKKLGLTQEIIDIEFGQITSGAVFTAKKCDVGAAAITITDERKRATKFSEPYFDSKQALLVKADSGITGLAGMKGKVLAIQTDTTGQKFGEEKATEIGYTTKVFDDMPTGSNAVLAGTADGTMNDNGVLLDFAKGNPSVKVVEEFKTGEQYGFNVGNDNAALAKAIDDTLAAAKADGTFNTVYKKWFGVEAPK